MSRIPPSEGFSREESRYLDGEMPADEQRRLARGLAADPDRARRVDAYREAMDVWREDAARTAGRADVPSLADRVVARIASGETPRLAVSRATPWYAAAAMVLIAVGLAGTLMSRPAPAPTSLQDSSLADLEETMMDLMIDGPEFSPPLAGSGAPK